MPRLRTPATLASGWGNHYDWHKQAPSGDSATASVIAALDVFVRLGILYLVAVLAGAVGCLFGPLAHHLCRIPVAHLALVRLERRDLLLQIAADVYPAIRLSCAGDVDLFHLVRLQPLGG